MRACCGCCDAVGDGLVSVVNLAIWSVGKFDIIAAIECHGLVAVGNLAPTGLSSRVHSAHAAVRVGLTKLTSLSLGFNFLRGSIPKEILVMIFRE